MKIKKPSRRQDELPSARSEPSSKRSAKANIDWPCIYGPFDGTRNFAQKLEPPLKASWKSKNALRRVDGFFVAGSGRAFAPTRDRGVVGFDLESGKQMWATKQCRADYARLWLFDNYVITFNNRESLVVLKAEDGKIVKSHKLKACGFPVGRHGNNLVANFGELIDPETLTVVARLKTNVHIAAHGNAFGTEGDDRSRLVCVDVRTKNALWKAPMHDDPEEVLLCATKDVLISTHRDEDQAGQVRIVARDVSKGTAIWSHCAEEESEDPYTHQPAVYKNRIYFNGELGENRITLNCIDANSGRIIWKAMPQPISRPIVCGKTLWQIAFEDGERLVARSLSNGKVTWSKSLEDEENVNHILAFTDGMLLLAEGEDLVCYRDVRGR